MLAVDGGNSKTDLALVGADGALLALGARPAELAAPHRARRLPRRARGACWRTRWRRPAWARAAGRRRRPGAAGRRRPARRGGARCRRRWSARGWAARTAVGNDTFAILRAGTDRGWGVAVVCGAGSTASASRRTAATARFPALGPITGDWGGGLRRRAGRAGGRRAQRGRARPAHARSSSAVPGRASASTPRASLREAIHLAGAIPLRRLLELAAARARRGRARRRGRRDRRPAGRRGRRVRARRADAARPARRAGRGRCSAAG